MCSPFFSCPGKPTQGEGLGPSMVVRVHISSAAGTYGLLLVWLEAKFDPDPGANLVCVLLRGVSSTTAVSHSFISTFSGPHRLLNSWNGTAGDEGALPVQIFEAFIEVRTACAA